ncbi:hypothetical protein FNV43_RR00664 [Rhamnella rubrinervis]|uniref:Uncharacterized protein n=1 Tax=Rhamnella rubrinervis TaxID=2594499 RepID=A0A8K0MRD3_9ROSA|nr:hypothetical protein FNV43_RR00664 [Rhamnella rubrinervis]
MEQGHSSNYGCWNRTVKAGSVFYDIVICDDPEYAKQVVEEVFANRKHHHRDWDDYHVSIHLCFTGDLV